MWRALLLSVAVGVTPMTTVPLARNDPGRNVMQASSFVVIVHATNSVNTIAQGKLSDLFLKRVIRWPDGTHIVPVDLPRRSPVREAFSKAVHGRSAASIGTYWQEQIFSGKNTPPIERANDADVIAFVRDNPGAIGYVAAGTPLGSGVKPVSIKGL